MKDFFLQSFKSVAVCGSKGGSGKTTLTALIALAIRECGQTIDVWDFNKDSPLLNLLFSCDTNHLEEANNSGVSSNIFEFKNSEINSNKRLKHAKILYERLSKISLKKDHSRFIRMGPLGDDSLLPGKDVDIEIEGITYETKNVGVPSDFIIGDFPSIAPGSDWNNLKKWDRFIIPTGLSSLDLKKCKEFVDFLKAPLVGCAEKILIVGNMISSGELSDEEYNQARHTLHETLNCDIAVTMFPWAQELGNATQAGIFEYDSEQKSTFDFFAKEVFGPKTIGQQMF